MKSNLKHKETEKIIAKESNTPHNEKPKKTHKKENHESYDLNYGIVNTIRQETFIEHKPIKNSLAELILNNEIETIKKILKTKKTNIDMRDEKGITSSWTPLYWSVKLRNIEIARILLNHGASINMVVNDFDECCGTVLDLATLRGDDEMESLLREFAEKDDINFGQSFTAIRTKLRGKAPAFNFKYYGKKKQKE